MSDRPRVERRCENDHCAIVFHPLVSDVVRGWGRFCSRSCAGSVSARIKHAKQSQRGEDNPNFKGWASLNKGAYVARFRAKYPDKARAHSLVTAAIRTGRLVRPESCQRCARPSAEPLHAHHEDYSRPLDVVFACRDCHRELDVERRQRQAISRPDVTADVQNEVRA